MLGLCWHSVSKTLDSGTEVQYRDNNANLITRCVRGNFSRSASINHKHKLLVKANLYFARARVIWKIPLSSARARGRARVRNVLLARARARRGRSINWPYTVSCTFVQYTTHIQMLLPSGQRTMHRGLLNEKSLCP